MNIQLSFFQSCKEKSRASHFAQEVADLLHLNPDAAYRRIRGTTALTLDEIVILSRFYHVSFDSSMTFQSKMVPFQFNAMFKDKFHIIEYLTGIAGALQNMAVNKKGYISMTAMDLPYFRQFGFKSLSRFKLFFWQRSVLNLESHRHKKFDSDEVVEDYEDIVDRINFYYHGVPSYEIWAPETMESTIKQIQYYVDSGLFKSERDFQNICDDLEDLLDKLEREAETGKKTILNEHGAFTTSFEMYQSDIFISNNCIQAAIDNEVFTYITFNSFNHLMTYAPEFSEECKKWMDQMRSKSILLSEVSEKFRYQFFLTQRKKIMQLRSEFHFN